MSTATRPGFRTVTVVEENGAFAIHLDERPLKSPAGNRYTLPTRPLAEAIAAEWAAAAPKPPLAEAMPLTRMAGTALDRMTAQRADIETQLLSYAETELTCYRADHPDELVERQHRAWQPLLDWLALRHDATLRPVAGIVAARQDRRALAALQAALGNLDSWRLAAVSLAVSVSGSIVIGLALADGRLTPEQAFEAAELDASYQIEKWGEDAEASARRAGVRADLELARQFLDLLASPSP